MLWLATGCSFPNGDDWTPAIKNGRYSVAAAVCASTNEPPIYREPEQKLTLYAFSDTTKHELVIDGADAWRVIEDADCRLVQQTRVETNDQSQFVLVTPLGSRFEPEACSLQVTFGEATIAVNESNTDFFEITEDLEIDLVFDTDETETGYQLQTSSSDELGELWQSYGCGDRDRILIELTRIEE